MHKRWLQRVGIVLSLALALCFWDVRAAAASEQSPTDDEYYCRFFVDDIIGDVNHVQEVSGVRGFYWFTDNTYDVYLFTWRPEVGVGLEFRRSDGVVAAMRGHVGFEPQVHYWECDETTSGN